MSASLLEFLNPIYYAPIATVISSIASPIVGAVVVKVLNRSSSKPNDSQSSPKRQSVDWAKKIAFLQLIIIALATAFDVWDLRRLVHLTGPVQPRLVLDIAIDVSQILYLVIFAIMLCNDMLNEKRYDKLQTLVFAHSDALKVIINILRDHRESFGGIENRVEQLLRSQEASVQLMSEMSRRAATTKPTPRKKSQAK